MLEYILKNVSSFIIEDCGLLFSLLLTHTPITQFHSIRDLIFPALQHYPAKIQKDALKRLPLGCDWRARVAAAREARGEA